MITEAIAYFFSPDILSAAITALGLTTYLSSPVVRAMRIP
jgi:hypothetical protein